MADRQMDSGGGKHFILLHGLAHGAWCWYKVVAQLRAAGHRATALDMAASGVHPARLHEVASFEDYSRPLLDAVAASPDSDRLVLVGHSLGGLSVALAMEWFPGKVAAAVFLAASMPRVGRHMGVTIEEVSCKSSVVQLICTIQRLIKRNGESIIFV
jgi:alpha-beta hydrolase superfamily lysophospholipase